MKFSQAHPGRVFVIRLEDGEVILYELTGSSGVHKMDDTTGFALLVP